MPFAQAGPNEPPKKRWSSWYDPSIVTRAGEDLLAVFDDFGVRTLREHKLVWSGWGDKDALDSNLFVQMPDSPGYGIRTIDDCDQAQLRLFFLSLLWRAAVSDLPEFREVNLRASDIRRIRAVLRGDREDNQSLYPVCLTQLTTRGPIHNLTPLMQSKPDLIAPGQNKKIPILRFYFDGLILHYHLESSAEEVAALENFFVGPSPKIGVTCVPFESSWQKENLDDLIFEAEERWPDRLAKIPGFGPVEK